MSDPALGVSLMIPMNYLVAVYLHANTIIDIGYGYEIGYHSDCQSSASSHGDY